MISPSTRRAVGVIAVVALGVGAAVAACHVTPQCPLADLLGRRPANVEPNVNPNGTGENPMSTASSHNQATGQVEHADAGDFGPKVLDSSVPVLVDFYADWCGPCQRLAPTLETLAQENPGARVVKVDVDRSPQLAMRYGVSAIPSLRVFKDGEVVAEHVGLASKGQLQAMLRQ